MSDKLTLEDGSGFVLLETGDYLLLETSGGAARTALNTRAFPLGVNVGMGWRMGLVLLLLVWL